MKLKLQFNLEEEVYITIKIEDKEHISYGKIISLKSTLNDLLEDGLPQVLIDKDIFESMGHPCDSYTLINMGYEL